MKYAAAIMAVCDKSYTWTYHDTSSLVSCPMSGVSSWTVTFYANPVAPSR